MTQEIDIPTSETSESFLPFQKQTTMKMMTQEIAKRLPMLYCKANTKIPSKDQMVHVHYFYWSCDRYGIEYDPKTWIFFWYASLGYGFEAGNFSIHEFEELWIVERDLHFHPKTLWELNLDMM